ncbi:hypothetical protein [Silanimonas sp.]|uniref:hypothetical protein n=1 Tax=Silanimonas sp. TaxID=1929290 RepID=UPI0022BAB94C|nr:hypothetical protein [Silanimonas sp.]MCZ8062268.1 hypothetical protein [Silanimonas sp.]
MTTPNDVKTDVKASEGRETKAQKALRLIASLDGDTKRQKMKQFEQYYPGVRDALGRNVPRKVLLKILEDAGLKLYPALFDELIETFASRDESGAGPCPTCGQATPSLFNKPKHPSGLMAAALAFPGAISAADVTEESTP